MGVGQSTMDQLMAFAESAHVGVDQKACGMSGAQKLLEHIQILIDSLTLPFGELVCVLTGVDSVADDRFYIEYRHVKPGGFYLLHDIVDFGDAVQVSYIGSGINPDDPALQTVRLCVLLGEAVVVPISIQNDFRHGRGIILCHHFRAVRGYRLIRRDRCGSHSFWLQGSPWGRRGLSQSAMRRGEYR